MVFRKTSTFFLNTPSHTNTHPHTHTHSLTHTPKIWLSSWNYIIMPDCFRCTTSCFFFNTLLLLILLLLLFLFLLLLLHVILQILRHDINVIIFFIQRYLSTTLLRYFFSFELFSTISLSLHLKPHVTVNTFMLR